jgi:hypothetical protein
MHIERRTFLKAGTAISAAMASEQFLSWFFGNHRIERPRLTASVESNSVLWGTSPDNNNTALAHKSAELLGMKPGIINYFAHALDIHVPDFLLSKIKQNADAGILSMISWQVDPNEFVNGGKIIVSWAKTFKDLGAPVLFRPGYEPNGKYPITKKGWMPLSNLKPRQFKAGWISTYGIFQDLGADNVYFVFSPNITTYADPIEPYYPGDEYTHLTSLDAYYKGTPPFADAHESLGPDIATLQRIAPTKPFLLSEINAIDEPSFVHEAINFSVQAGASAVLLFEWNKQGFGETDWRVQSNPHLAQLLSANCQQDFYHRDSSTVQEKMELLLKPRFNFN